MKIHLLSDLHTEFGNRLPDPRPADVLVLAGDIGVGRHEVKRILNHYSPFYNHVFYVPGNHEYYGSTMRELDDLEVPGNVHAAINPIAIIIEGVKFIGASLWTDFHDSPSSAMIAARMINDFRVIKNFTVHDSIKLNKQHKQFIEQNYEPGCVIVTHFLPSLECVAPQYKNSPANPYFANNLDVKDYACDWLFGHTHNFMQKTVGKCKLHANPLGYPHENAVFQENYTIIV